MNFNQLHHQEKPLLLANVWDVTSAKTAEVRGFDAIGTSSAGMAALLGYEDGEHMPFEILRFMVECIAQSTLLPLSVDIEAGYSRDSSQVLANIEQLVLVLISKIA